MRGCIVGLVALVNTHSTVDKVRNFLTEEFTHLVVKAGYSMVQVQSPNMSGLIKAATTSNNVERGMIDHMDAQRIVPEVVGAIYRCPEPYSKILKLVYLQQLPEKLVLDQLPYERAQYYRLKFKSLLWFADSYERITDFHVYS